MKTFRFKPGDFIKIKGDGNNGVRLSHSDHAYHEAEIIFCNTTPQQYDKFITENNLSPTGILLSEPWDYIIKIHSNHREVFDYLRVADNPQSNIIISIDEVLELVLKEINQEIFDY